MPTKYADMTEEQKERQKEYNRKYRANMTEEKLEEQQRKRRKWWNNRTEEQIAKSKARVQKRLANMTEDQKKEETERQRIYRASRTEQQYRKDLVCHLRGRAKNKEIPFNLTLDYINAIWPEDNRCPALGIPFVRHSGAGRHNSPSVDKLNPALGYVKGNVAIVSHRANTIMHNAKPSEVMTVAKWFASVQCDWS